MPGESATISREMTDMAMNLAATLAAERIAETIDCTRTQALEMLLSSETGAALYDDSLKLWWESPLDIADACLREYGAGLADDTGRG